MSLQFILGNSGSGKTDQTYRNIVKEAACYPRKDYLVIVPEQFTLQTQKKLVDLAPAHAIMNIDVLSFKRLAYRVFDELGLTTMNILEDTGKNLLLRKVAADRKTDLTVLAPNVDRMGYIDEVKSLISELVQYNVSPAQLRDYAQGSDLAPAFSSKLLDIALLYEEFQKDMEGRFITAEEILHVLIQVAGDSEILRDSVIVLDEFTGFTPIQNQLLRRLMPLAEKIQVILTIDIKEHFYRCQGMEELFYLTKNTIQSLSRMAQELGIPQEKPILCSDSANMRFKNASDLAFLEQNLFRKWYRVCKQKPEHIHLASLYNPKDELVCAAREIHRLVAEEGFRYREIAVVSGDAQLYGNYAEEIFGRYRIPWFLDTTREIVFHPFIECVRAILQVLEEDYSHEAMFRFLRTGFSGLAEGEVDLLDNYVTALGIRGRKQWTSRWLRDMRDRSCCTHEEMDLLRERIIKLFLPLDEAFRDKGRTVHSQILALYHFLTEIRSEETLRKREEEHIREGHQTAAAEYAQIYRIVLQLLEKYDNLLGGEHMTTEEFSEILDAGLSGAQVAAVPPGYDCVTIGDIERTRLNHIRILFFVGVNDGIIPKAASAGGIISEFEREQMEAADIPLAPGAREQTFIQRFYLYRNLTKPSAGLYLSWSRVDSQGQTAFPSYLAETLHNLFPAAEVQEYDRMSEILSTASPDAAREYLIHGKREEDWYALAACLLGKEPEKTGQLLEAGYRKHTDDPISRAVCEALYGRHLKGNVTRLEKFASCAYAHFLSYGLKLQEREECAFENTDMGTLYHTALQKYSVKLASSDYDWFTVPEDIRLQLCRNAMEETLEESNISALFATAENVHRTVRMEEILEETVWALTMQVRAGSFVPTLFETPFSKVPDSGEKSISLGEGHTMELTGQIDRLDFLEKEGKLYVKVIDYKSGSTKFDLVKVYHGLSLQLVVYLNTALAMTGARQEEAQPAAILYYNIDDPQITDQEGTGLEPDEIQRALLESLKPNGLVNENEGVIEGLDQALAPGDTSLVIPVVRKKDGSLSARSSVVNEEDFSVIREYTRRTLREFGSAIYQGDISVKPYADSCTYCPYSAVCGIHSRLDGFKTRTLCKGKNDEILEAMKKEVLLDKAKGTSEEIM